MIRKTLAVILTAALIAILLLGVSELPDFGDPESPVHNYVSERYIEKSMEETGVTNIVAGVILDYRAFDTFVEASVLFTSIIVIVCIMMKDSKLEMEEDE